MKRLLAAIATVRGKLALIEALLEEGKLEQAANEIEETERAWRDAVEEARP